MKIPVLSLKYFYSNRLRFCEVLRFTPYHATKVCSSKISPVVKPAEENPVIKLLVVSGFAACLAGSAVCLMCFELVIANTVQILWLQGKVAAAQHATLNSALQYRVLSTLMLTEHYVNAQFWHKSTFSG